MATCLNSSSFQTIYVCNEHCDYDQHRHPVPRIGKSDISRVGPTLFEFDLPGNCPFELSPAVGTINPGQVSKLNKLMFEFFLIRIKKKLKRVKVTLQYTAKLDEDSIKNQAYMILKEKAALEAANNPVEVNL